MFCDILFIAKSPFDKFFCSINILSDFLLFLYMSGVTSIVTLQRSFFLFLPPIEKCNVEWYNKIVRYKYEKDKKWI